MRRTVLAIVVLLVALLVQLDARGTLTAAQRVALKADILANGDANTLYQDGNLAGLADLYNANASPAFWVWKSSVQKHEVTSTQSTDTDGTTTRNFIWTGNGFITRSVGEQAAWAELWNSSQSVNPSLPNVRAAFNDIFSGTGNAASNRTHLLNMARRLATRIEKVFAIGTGTPGAPATMAFEGPLNVGDLIGL